MLSLPTDRTSVRNEPSDRALILVVERNPLVQRLEKYFLEQAGYVVEFAGDGLLALKKAQELKPKILVTEILVPKLDGLSLCGTLKSDPKTRHILILVFSHLHGNNALFGSKRFARLIPFPACTLFRSRKKESQCFRACSRLHTHLITSSKWNE